MCYTILRGSRASRAPLLRASRSAIQSDTDRDTDRDTEKDHDKDHDKDPKKGSRAPRAPLLRASRSAVPSDTDRDTLKVTAHPGRATSLRASRSAVPRDLPPFAPSPRPLADHSGRSTSSTIIERVMLSCKQLRHNSKLWLLSVSVRAILVPPCHATFAGFGVTATCHLIARNAFCGRFCGRDGFACGVLRASRSPFTRPLAMGSPAPSPLPPSPSRRGERFGIFQGGGGTPLPLFRFAPILSAPGKNFGNPLLALRANLRDPYVFPTAPFLSAPLSPSPCSARASGNRPGFALFGFPSPPLRQTPSLRSGRGVFSRGAGVPPSPSSRFARLRQAPLPPSPCSAGASGSLPRLRFGRLPSPPLRQTPVLSAGEIGIY